MPRIESRRSDTSDVELDGIAEQELARLQQEYRIMEGDRKAYSEESHNFIRKQLKAIAILQSENEELLKDNRLAGSQQNQTNDMRNIDSLTTMMNKEGDLKKQIEGVKDAIKSLDQEIHQTERKIALQRKNMGGVHTSQVKHVTSHKQVRVLENRLDQANKKFNEALAKNSELREEIDHMRTERTIFHGLYKKLEKKLHENKEEIAKVIESSTASYDARDDAQNKMITLKEKADKELQQYNMELKELMRVIDHDRRLKEFMSIKSEDRAGMVGLTYPYSYQRGEERDKKNEREEAIQSFEAAFDKIRGATGIEDLQLLVGKFIETEDKNFALFNYVNELNNEIELLQEQIHAIEDDIRRLSLEMLNLDGERANIVQEMQTRYDEGEKVAAFHQDACKTSNKILTQLKQGIESVFKKINCDTSSIVDMLGGHSGVTDTNLIQYLGIIEQRTNELIQVKAFLSNTFMEEDEESVKEIGLLGEGPLRKPSAVLHVQPPATGDDESDFSLHSEDENRPLTQNELRERIVRGISKKEKSKSKPETGHESLSESKNSTRKGSKRMSIIEKQ